jgi:hypothetical protein
MNNVFIGNQQKFSDNFQFVNEYFKLLTKYYSGWNYSNIHCTYYSFDIENNIQDADKLMSGAYETIGKLSGYRWRKILDMPLNNVEALTTTPISDEKGVTYFPYLAIEHFLELKGNIKYIYLIDKDFFSQKGSNLFHDMLREKGSILSLIALPQNFFQSDECTKSILVLNNQPSSKQSTEIFVLPTLKEKHAFSNVMDKIKEHLENN